MGLGACAAQSAALPVGLLFLSDVVAAVKNAGSDCFFFVDLPDFVVCAAAVPLDERAAVSPL